MKWFQKACELDNQFKAWLFKERCKTIQKDWNWKTRIIFFIISGCLGWWGTLTIWNDGMVGYIAGRGHGGYISILGAIDPLMGWLAILACILSIFFFNEVVAFPQEED